MEEQHIELEYLQIYWTKVPVVIFIKDVIFQKKIPFWNIPTMGIQKK
jgi:hypothetical protein